MEKHLSDYSPEELQKKERTTKLSISVLGGMLLVMFGVSVYLTILEGFNVFTVLPFAFLPVFIALLSNLKKIQKEIGVRKL